MQTHRPMIVKCEMKTPIIVTRPLHFDALLGNLLVQRGAEPHTVNEIIPLSRRNGVFCGSVSILTGPCVQTPVSIIQALNARRDVDPSRLRKVRNRHPRVEVSRGPYKNLKTDLKMTSATAVYFSAMGNIDEVRDLMSGIPGIGKKQSMGYGEVRSTIVEEITFSNAGWKTNAGLPARPIPIDSWEGSVPDCPKGLTRIMPPYWEGPFSQCYIPSEIIGIEDDEALTLLGFE